MRILIILALLCAAAVEARAAARETYEGYWAETRRDCRDEDGPNSRTVIDLHAAATGPLLDRYENHCRILSRRSEGGGVVLRLRCHEFWDDFRKRANGRDATARITVTGADSIAIDGRSYMRCRR